MIVAVRLREVEADRDDVEKGWVGGRDAKSLEVVSGVEQELIRAGVIGFPGQQGSVGAPVRVRDRVRDLAPIPATESEQLDSDTMGRLAVGGVEHVGGQAAHGDSFRETANVQAASAAVKEPAGPGPDEPVPRPYAGRRLRRPAQRRALRPMSDTVTRRLVRRPPRSTVSSTGWPTPLFWRAAVRSDRRRTG